MGADASLAWHRFTKSQNMRLTLVVVCGLNEQGHMGDLPASLVVQVAPGVAHGGGAGR